MEKRLFNKEVETVVISSSGEYEIVLDSVLKADIEIKEHVHAVVFLKLMNSDCINLHINVLEGAQLNILHHCEQNLSLQEKADVYNSAQVQAGFYVLDKIETSMNIKYMLKESDAQATLMTSTLSETKNVFDVECVHEVPMTSSYMENYAISKDSGDYVISASGKIVKGAFGSKSHQSTRVLTMGEKQNASVTPLLLIDENDVEASHACAVGAMNEDHLYYLKTRGLNEKQALGLLTLSYVLPVLRIVENSVFEEQVEKEIESKVGLSC